MGAHRITLNELRRILAVYGVVEDPKRGKGSHTFFKRSTPEGEFGYPIPTHDKHVLPCYVKGVRRALRITDTDEEFFAKL